MLSAKQISLLSKEGLVDGMFMQMFKQTPAYIDAQIGTISKGTRIILSATHRLVFRDKEKFIYI